MSSSQLLLRATNHLQFKNSSFKHGKPQNCFRLPILFFKCCTTTPTSTYLHNTSNIVIISITYCYSYNFLKGISRFSISFTFNLYLLSYIDMERKIIEIDVFPSKTHKKIINSKRQKNPRILNHTLFSFYYLNFFLLVRNVETQMTSYFDVFFTSPPNHNDYCML